jgi:hypothetical protein
MVRNTTTDPMTLNDVTDLERAPFVIQVAARMP